MIIKYLSFQEELGKIYILIVEISTSKGDHLSASWGNRKERLVGDMRGWIELEYSNSLVHI